MGISKLTLPAIIASVVMLQTACTKDSDFPATPELNVREFTRGPDFDAVWRIGFTDGDGDFGVRNDNDPDNFIVTIFKIENGVGIEQNSTNYRVPQIKDVPIDKGVEGEFKLDINLELVLIDGIDSLFYTGYAVDRSGNRSNTVQSPRIRVN